MKELKSLVKKPDKPFQQVVNRYSEIDSATKTNLNLVCHSESSGESPELKRLHKNGSLINNIN